VIVYQVAARPSFPKGIYIRVVPVYQYSRLGRFQRDGQQLGGPEDPFRRRPCLLRMAVQPMNKNDVDFRIGVVVYFGELKSFNGVWVDCGAL
jgi:hypothetical protein